MTYTKSTLSRRYGFTLVELLVVISIIAVLASLGFAGFNMAIQKAKKTSAKAAISSLVQACNDYYEDESIWCKSWIISCVVLQGGAQTKRFPVVNATIGCQAPTMSIQDKLGGQIIQRFFGPLYL